MRPDKQTRRLVREYAGKAYELDLRMALTPLAEAFRAWERGELDSFELEARIHRFHQHDARELYNRWATRDLEPALANAIAAGSLPRASLPPALVDHLASLIALFEDR